MGSHALVRRAFGRRKHRPHLCGGLGAGHLCCEPRPVHCLHLERICHPGPSIPLFFVGGVINLFVYLRYGLGVVLGFVGIKMMLVDIYKIPIGISLAVVAGILALSIVASLFVQAESRGSSAFQFSFAGSFAKSNRFWIWLAIIGVVLAAVVLVQAASPITIF